MLIDVVPVGVAGAPVLGTTLASEPSVLKLIVPDAIRLAGVAALVRFDASPW